MQLSNSLIPIIVIGIIAYFMAVSLLSVYGMAIDTIMLCYCEDCDRNKADMTKCYVGSPIRKAIGLAGEPMRAASPISLAPAPTPGGKGVNLSPSKAGGGAVKGEGAASLSL